MQHKWIKNDYDESIDIFQLSHGTCNGPKCELCGYEFCHHCSPGGYKTKCPATQLRNAKTSELMNIKEDSK